MSADEDGTDPASRARDHMANERTYLAWLRTAVNVMIVGLAVARFGSGGGRADALALSAGALLVAVGGAGLGYGTLRYRAVNRELEDGRFVTGSSGVGPQYAAVVLFVSLVVATVLLVVDGFG
jgi:putative membrane protein